jgi:hypothetical protein
MAVAKQKTKRNNRMLIRCMMTLLEDEFVIGRWDRAGEEEAGKQAPRQPSGHEERAQRKTGVGAGYHFALPLGLVMQLG